MRPRRLTLTRVAEAEEPVYNGYAFGGGGSGDSTREGVYVTTSAGTPSCQDRAATPLSTIGIAEPLEHVLIAGQQSEGA